VTYVDLGCGGQFHPRFAPLTARLAATASGYSYVRCEADARTLRLEGLSSDGQVFDSVTLTR
jgi:hypothetical protein